MGAAPAILPLTVVERKPILVIMKDYKAVAISPAHHEQAKVKAFSLRIPIGRYVERLIEKANPPAPRSKR